MLSQDELSPIGVVPSMSSAQVLSPASSGSDASAPGEFMFKNKRKIEFVEALSVCVGVVAPCFVLLTFFSNLGFGIRIYNEMAPSEVSLLGDAFIGLALAICAAYYVLDWPVWAATVQGIVLVPPWACFMMGAVMKSRNYPFLPILVIVIHIPLNMGCLRTCFCRDVERWNFYAVVSAANLLSAVVVIILWLAGPSGCRNWSHETRFTLAARSKTLYDNVYNPMFFGPRSLDYANDCGPDKDTGMFSLDEQIAIRNACTHAMTIMFMVWACPWIAICVNFVLFAFSFLIATSRGAEGIAAFERIVRNYVLFLLLFFGGLYTAAVCLSSVSLSLTGTIASFFTACVFTLMTWVYIEVDTTDITDRAIAIRNSKMVKHVPEWVWNLSRAMFIFMLNLSIPSFFALDFARQKVRLLRGVESVASSRWTSTGRRVLREFRHWRWTNTLWWVCAIGEFYFTVQIVGAKCTYIFLSWLNMHLANLPIWAGMLVVFVVGLFMFLIPVVPGVAVYLFAGAVMTEQGKQHRRIGAAAGTLTAILVSFLMKLVACVMQYFIGYAAGQRLWVQKLVGVDRVFTRATNVILQKPGLSIGKVGVLIGGPDWPVSVGCGILRVDVFQMLLGTTPVIVVLAPVVCAGGYTSQLNSADTSTDRMLAVMLASIALLLQGSCALSATVSIIKVVEEQGEVLAQPRPEHAKVASVTRKQARRNQAMYEATCWSSLSWARRLVIVSAAGLMIMACAIFVFLDEVCFENFSLTGRIDDPLDEMGLGGNPLNIVVWPYGYVPLTMFGMAFALHFMFAMSTDRVVREKMRDFDRLHTNSPAVPPQLIGNFDVSGPRTALSSRS